MLGSRRRSATAVLVALTMALVAPACGMIGGDDKPKTTTTPLPTLPPTTAAPAVTTTVVPQEYIVQAGDSLSKIAKMFGVTVAALVAENAIQDPDKIVEGQRLKIPTPTTTTAAGGAAPPPGATTAPPPATTAPPVTTAPPPAST
jgi:lipoprotein NlpD